MSKVCKQVFDILGHLVKKLSLRSLKDGIVTELLIKKYKGSGFCNLCSIIE